MGTKQEYAHNPETAEAGRYAAISLFFGGRGYGPAGPRLGLTKLVAMRTVALMICAGILSAAFCQDGGESKKMATPALPFYDWGACPYESCAYRQWTAHRSATVYDAWKPERRAIAQLQVGEQVTGITSTVVTYQPGLIRIDGDLPDRDLQRGDTVLTYAYRGEGFSAVWFKGKYHSLFDISFAKWPDSTGCGVHIARPLTWTWAGSRGGPRSS
jgi:hypothetical protein